MNTYGDEEAGGRNITVRLLGGTLDDPNDRIALYEFRCTAPEFRRSANRLRALLKSRYRILATSERQLPVAEGHDWVGAMMAVVRCLTLRKNSAEAFGDTQERVVREGLCTTIDSAVEGIGSDDQVEVFLTRKTDIVVRVRRRGAGAPETVELGNINAISSRIAALGDDTPPTVH